ncbi:MAG: response regulator [Myxococcaceae bacterium]
MGAALIAVAPVTAPRRRVLFVEDDLQVLAMTRMLMRRRREWDVTYCASGQEAIAAMETASFDVVVTDLRMPVMDGAQLLSQVRERWPGSMRVVVSGGSDNAAIMRTLPVCHQFLSKPYEIDDLIGLVDRAERMRAVLEDTAGRALAGKLDRLPSVPQTYLELTQAASSNSSSAADLSKIIERDPAMAAKVLQLVNSAYFGLPQKIASISQAVAYLGAELLKGLALTARLFSAAGAGPKGFSIERLQEHSLLTARLAKRFVTGKQQSEVAFTGGLMHGVGQLILSQCMGPKFGEAIEAAKAEKRPLEQLEREKLSLDHAQAGAFLLGSWGLPFRVVEAVAFHLQPSKVIEAGCVELAAVYVANIFAAALREKVALPGDSAFDLDFLARAGVRDELQHWRTLAAACAI